MKIKVSHPTIKALNETLQLHGMRAVMQELPERVYALHVDYDTFSNEIDWNPAKSKFKVIRIDYPESYYACSQYCTTKDLTRIFRACGGNTWSAFIQEFMNCYQI